MANPFDQFDSSNPFDQFDEGGDLVSQIPGMGPAPAPYKDDSSLIDKAKGVIEAGAQAATSLPAGIVGAIGGLGNDERAGKIAEELTYAPRTEKGREYGKEVGDFSNYYLNPLLGHIGSTHSTKAGEMERPEPIKEVVKKEAPKKPINPFDQFDLLESDNQGKAANKYEAQEGYWTVDENGIPIRADLSMEAQNLENPLQHNLWGDELTTRENPVGQSAQLPMDRDVMGFPKMTEDPSKIMENDLGMTQALDKMEDTPWRGPRDEATNLLKGEVDAGGELNAAKMTADSPFPAPEGGMRVPRSQRGGINVDAFELHPYLKDLWHKLTTGDTLNLKEHAFMRQLQKEDYLGFDRPQDAIRALYEDGKGDFEVSPQLKAAATNLSFYKRQRGAVNPEIFKEGFQKLKQLADGTWLRAHSDGQALTIDAIKDSHKLGSSTFDTKHFGNDKNLEAFITRVSPEERGKGYASEMYKFASELDNDIQRSSAQTDLGKKMWDGFERTGLAKDGIIKSPGRRQLGAVRLGEKRNQQLEKVLGRKNMIPDDPDVKAGIQEAYGDADATGGTTGPSTLFESGSTLGWMKRRSGAVQLASRLLQNAEKRGSLNIIKHVFPTEKSFRALSKPEFAQVANLLKGEMLKGERLSADALDHLTVKQKEAYVKIRDMLDHTMTVQNEARAAKGQKPITSMEAYMSSRWDGAHRRPVFQAILDKNGNPKFDENGEIQKRVVWYLASDSKRGLEAQSKALLKDHPDLLVDSKYDHMLRNYKKQTDLQSAYTTMLDVLGRDDPTISRMKEILETQTINEGASFLGQEKHFKEKTGVRGFVGDRPGKVGKFNEDLAFIQQQIQYAKNAYNWSEIQKAGQGIKDIITDPRLKQEQPNNVKYIREYYKNQVGHGEAAAVAHMTDALRELGFNVDQASKYLGGAKTYFILSKLGASTGNFIVNMLQSANMLPHLLSDEWSGNRTNIPKAIAVGIPGGIAMASGHYLNLIRKSKDIPQDMKGFYERAFQYAEDNGITARSIYDESPIESSFSSTMKTANAFGRTISVPETFTRSIAYNMAVQFLKDSGKFTKDIDLFQRAEEMVNAAMVDYRTKERPMAFAKLGAVGNFLNTLQTFPMNWYNQWSYFAREGMKGNIAPFMGAFALQYAMAGAMGMPYFNDLDRTYQFIKDHLPSDYYLKIRNSEFWDDPKMWMMKNLGSASVYGWLSDKTGIGLTTRLAPPGMEDMIQAPAGPAVDAAKQLYYAGKAAVSPTKDNVAQSAMASTPVGLQGLVEYAPQFEGSTFEKDANGNTLAMRPGAIDQHTAVYRRSPEEDTIRKFGLRSTKEMIEREVNYRTSRNDQVASEKERSVPAAIYAAAKSGDKDRVRDLMDVYVKLHGSELTQQQWDSLMERNFMTASERSMSKDRLTPLQLRNLVRAKSIIDEVNKEVKQK